MLRLTTLLWIAAALLVPSAGGSTGGSIARFREVETSSSSLGDFAGATSTWRSVIKLSHSDKSVGTGVLICIRVSYNSSLQSCRGTYLLPRGQVEISGLISTKSRYTLIITGSSGVYADKDGTASIAQIGSHPWTAFVTFYFL